jgi:hypothetical protein
LAAGGDVLNYPKVLETDATSILTKLRLEAARAAFQRRHSTIIHQKKD